MPRTIGTEACRVGDRVGRTIDKLKVATIVVVTLVVACARKPASPQLSFVDLLSNNRTNLQRLAIGMDRAEVVSVMGSTPSTTGGRNGSNPYETETIAHGQTSYEILYSTRKYPPFTAIKRSQATPVIFRDGKLIGWGDSALEAVYNEPTPAPAPTLKPATKGKAKKK